MGAFSNTLQLVVQVETDKANSAIKGVNVGLSGIERSATSSTGRASRGFDVMTAHMRKSAEGVQLLAHQVGVALPRGLSQLIAKLPGVETALKGAFAAGAIIAAGLAVAALAVKIKFLRDDFRDLGAQGFTTWQIITGQARETANVIQDAQDNTNKFVEAQRAQIRAAETAQALAGKTGEPLRRAQLARELAEINRIGGPLSGQVIAAKESAARKELEAEARDYAIAVKQSALQAARAWLGEVEALRQAAADEIAIRQQQAAFGKRFSEAEKRVIQDRADFAIQQRDRQLDLELKAIEEAALAAEAIGQRNRERLQINLQVGAFARRLMSPEGRLSEADAARVAQQEGALLRQHAAELERNRATGLESQAIAEQAGILGLARFRQPIAAVEAERARAIRELGELRREQFIQEADYVTRLAAIEARAQHDRMEAIKDFGRELESLYDRTIGAAKSLGEALKNIAREVAGYFKRQFFNALAGTILGGGQVGQPGQPGTAAFGGGFGRFAAALGLSGIGSSGAGGFPGVPIPGAPGGTVGFAGPVSGVGGTGAGAGALGGFGGLAGLKDFLGIGGSIQTGAGTATTFGAASLGQKLGALGRSNAALLAGGTLAYLGLKRGGLSGLGMTTAGGALIGFRFGGPLGAAIGAAAGFGAGLIRLFIKGAQEKAREKIKAVYGVDLRDKGLLAQIVDTAKQRFGGNLDVAIRSPEIRELVELYAMTTGQKAQGLPATIRPLTLAQTGGGLFQQTGFANGAPLAGFGGLPTLDRIGAGVMQNAGPTVVRVEIPLQMDGEVIERKTVDIITRAGRLISAAVVSGAKANAGRRELTAVQISPGTLTS